MAPSRLAALPAANALILNRPIWNIGSAILVSKTQNAISITVPPISPVMIKGFIQPVA